MQFLLCWETAGSQKIKESSPLYFVFCHNPADACGIKGHYALLKVEQYFYNYGTF